MNIFDKNPKLLKACEDFFSQPRDNKKIKIGNKIVSGWKGIAKHFNLYNGNDNPGEDLRNCYKSYRRRENKKNICGGRSKVGIIDEFANLGESFKEFGKVFDKKTLKNLPSTFTTSKEETTILCLSDLHYPYNINLDFLVKYKDKIDILLLNGDIMDCQSISKFPKKYRDKLSQDMIGTRELIVELITIINPKKTLVNYGNHEQRLGSYLSRNLNEDIMELMPSTPLDLIIDNGFYNYNHRNNTKVYYEPLVKHFNIEYTNSWYNKIGKVIFCHPISYRAVPMGTAENAFKYFNQQGEDFTSIVVGHTHQTGFYKYGNVYLIEQGALCVEPEYAVGGKLMRKQNRGYAFISLDEKGNLDYNKSKLEILD